MEFPHLLTLIEGVQFDTIYHEHYFYFSLYAVIRVFRSHGLEVFDVGTLPTHGGSLRVFASTDRRPKQTSMGAVLWEEEKAGLMWVGGYNGFQEKVDAVKAEMNQFLDLAFVKSRTLAAYGAPAKGSTFLNACRVHQSNRGIAFTVDDSPHKQGKLMPGSGIPIVGRERLLETMPDYVLVLPWNLLEPIRKRNPEVEAWGGRWVTAIPEIKIHEP
jgi:hypothetical protein